MGEKAKGSSLTNESRFNNFEAGKLHNFEPIMYIGSIKNILCASAFFIILKFSY